MDAALGFRSICGEVGRLLRAKLPFLLAAGLVIFAPLALVDTLLDVIPEPEDPADAIGLAAAIAAAAASVATSLLGEVFYIAMVSAAVVTGNSRESVNVRRVLGELPVGRLLVADVAYALLVVVGLLALVVPGFLFLAWFALVPPAIEIEHRPLAAAFRRSRSLVRRRFWLVLGITVPLALSSELISELAFSGSAEAFGDTFAGEWAGAVLSELLTAPLFALFVVVLFLRLRDAADTQPG